jgi:hypothetical protein
MNDAPAALHSTVGRSTPRRVRFRLAGYLFTYCRATEQARVRIDMWREDRATGERYWITVATTAPDRASARAVALALVAWVRWCDVGPRATDQARAVAESFAMLRERIESRAPGVTGRVTARPAGSATRPGAAGETPVAAA